MKKNPRTTIPQVNKVRAGLQKEIGSTCPFCDSDDVGHFEIHHINGDRTDHDALNLILVCPTCHSKIEKGDFAPIDVKEKKIQLLMKPRKVDKVKSINIKKVNNAVIGDNNTVTIKQSTKKKIEKYPEGCIGHDTVKGNYIDYLIARFEKYKEYEVGKSKMSYGLYRRQLKSKYKLGPTRNLLNLPISRFDDLVSDIQLKIDGTKLARINGHGHKNYSAFDEYSTKMNEPKKSGE